jgi:DNA end-binding protein Ku
MTARSIWAGSINFGLVSIPVKLYTATDDETDGLTFHQVRRSDGSRIKYRRVAEADGQEVPYADIVSGLEWGDQIVVLTDEELAELPLATLKQVEVLHFCDPAEVSPLLRGKEYYLLPASDAAARAYRLLWTALSEQHLAGIGKIALRKRERLCMLTVREDVIELTTLLWPAQVRELPAVATPEVPAPELALARQLVEALTAPFQPADYTDEYAAAVQALAQRKVDGMPAPEPKSVSPSATDLESMLTAAVAAVKAQRKEVA